jgi:hypothetical protein
MVGGRGEADLETELCNKSGESGALTPGTAYLGAQN